MLAEHIGSKARSRPRWSPAMSGLSDMFPLHDVKHSPATLTAAIELLIDSGRVPRAPPRLLVEPDGIEPTTSCLQSTRSPN
jgi:hypothetical protein